MASVPDTLLDLTAGAGDGDETDRTRQILLAAYSLLEEAGLEGLTIRAVLQRTGLARRAFYDRFASKDDLVLAVFEQTLRAASVYFRREATPIADPLERIKLIVSSIVMGTIDPHNEDHARSDRRAAALSREHLRLAESRPAELEAALSPLLALIAEYVDEGIRTGQLRTSDPALTATLVYNLVSTTVHTEMLAEEGGSRDRARRQQLGAEIWEFCRRAIIA